MNPKQIRARLQEIGIRIGELNGIADRSLTADETTEFDGLITESNQLRADLTAAETRAAAAASIIAFTSEPDPNQPSLLGRSMTPTPGSQPTREEPQRGTPEGTTRANDRVDLATLTREMELDLVSRATPDRAIRAALEAGNDEVFGRYLRANNGTSNGLARIAQNPEFRALNESIISDGGAVVPPQFLARVIDRRVTNHDALINSVQTLRTSADHLEIPKFLGGSATDGSSLGVQWPGETGAATEDTSLENWSSVKIHVHRGSMIIVASRSIIEDSSFPLEAWVARKIAQKYAATLAYLIINGDGNGKPFGFLTRTVTGNPNTISSTNVGANIGHAGLMALMGETQAEYAEFAKFLMRRVTLWSYIFGDTENGAVMGGTRHTTDGGAQARIENVLYGYPVIQNDLMTAPAGAAKAIMFADWMELYTLLERVVLTIEPYIDGDIQKRDQVAWYVRFRVGGDVLQENAGRVGVMS